MPTSSPGPLLQALDALWAHLRGTMPELPNVRFIVSPGASTTNHGPERWRHESDDLVSGIVITADHLTAGPGAVLEYVLHDAAHLLNWLRGVEDTTMRGAYHNSRFVNTARELGLIWPDGQDRDKARGYAVLTMTSDIRRMHAPDLASLGAAIPQVLPHLTVPVASAPGAKRPDRANLECKCTPARKIRVSRTVAALGPITCGVCGGDFEVT
ncbi:hypothetical protein [Streptomyces niveus]|uniref:hypothetical protein n=1 Tax=Streptomyces niveus TaxID=193462 RepID=UPI0036557369